MYVFFLRYLINIKHNSWKSISKWSQNNSDVHSKFPNETNYLFATSETDFHKREPGNGEESLQFDLKNIKEGESISNWEVYTQP